MGNGFGGHCLFGRAGTGAYVREQSFGLDILESSKGHAHPNDAMLLRLVTFSLDPLPLGLPYAGQFKVSGACPGTSGEALVVNPDLQLLLGGNCNILEVSRCRVR